MTTLRLKTKSARADALIAERREIAKHQAAALNKPKKKAVGGTHTPATRRHSLTHMDQFVGKPVELRLSTGEILTGRFVIRRYDILLDCDDGRALCCHKHQIVWCRLIGENET